MTKIIKEIQSKIGCKGKTVIMPYNEWLDEGQTIVIKSQKGKEN